MYDDETLWHGLMKGDREMFLALYKKYYHCLLFIGLSEEKNPDLVKDTIQQQFLYLWEKRESIHAANNVKSYLVTSFLRMLSRDSKQARRINHSIPVDWCAPGEQVMQSPEETLIIKGEQQKSCELLASRVYALPPRQKELIVLRFYEGLTYEEIVQRTGLTHRSVYNSIHEALKKLKLEIPKKENFYGTALSLFMSFLASACN